jgi:hypothetical protein
MLDSEIPSPTGASAKTLAVVRRAVRELLERSTAFPALPPETQREIAANTVRVIASLTGPDAARRAAPPARVEAASPADLLLREVEFPAFVAELIHGVFQAVVDSSVQQMRAYGELIARASKSIDAFVDDNRSENEPAPGEAEDETQAASSRTLDSGRQQQLATMVLMGINRIMEEGAPPSASPDDTTGRTSASSSFKSDYLPLEK